MVVKKTVEHQQVASLELSRSFDIAREVYTIYDADGFSYADAVYSVASLDETVTHNGIYIGSTGNTWLHEVCPGDETV